MPDDLKARVQIAAESNGRSLHAELLARLEQSFGGEDPEQLQLLISRLQGELSGSKFVASALMEESSKRIGEMSFAYATAKMLALRVCDLFDEMADLAESYSQGEIKDPALASARHDTLVDERLDIENSLDQIEPPGDKAVVEVIVEQTDLIESSRRKARENSRKTKP